MDQNRWRASTRQVWIVGGVMITIQVALIVIVLLFLPTDTLATVQGGSAPEANTDNFLAAVGALVALGFGFLVGFLGLKRLEQFDNEIGSVRRELAATLSAERERMAAADARAWDELNRRYDEFSASFGERAQNAVGREISSQRREIGEEINLLRSETDRDIQRIETALRPYAWLQERKSEVDFLVGIGTTGAAQMRVREFVSERKMDIALQIIEHVIVNSLPGSSNDYHNLATTLARERMHDLAVQILDQGLRKFPGDVDLLADAISMNVDLGDFEAAFSAYDALKGLDPMSWNWRAFVFAADLFIAAGRPGEARSLWSDFRHRIPTEDRGYSSEGRYLLDLGRVDEAIDLLESGLQNCGHAPQSAAILTDAYLELGQYENAIRSANKATEATYDEQSRVDQQSVIYARAAAADGLIHELLLNSTPDLSQVANLVERCVADYRLLPQLSSRIPHYIPRSRERLAILRSTLITSGFPGEDIERWWPSESAAPMVARSPEEQSEEDSGAESPSQRIGPRELAALVVSAARGDEGAKETAQMLLYALANNPSTSGLADSLRSVIRGERNSLDLSSLDPAGRKVVQLVLEALAE